MKYMLMIILFCFGLTFMAFYSANKAGASNLLKTQITVHSLSNNHAIVTLTNNGYQATACAITTSNDEAYYFELRQGKESRTYSIRLPVKWVKFGCY